MNTSRPRGQGLVVRLLAVLSTVALGMGMSVAAAIPASATDTNQASYWETQYGECEKLSDTEQDAPYVLGAEPEGVDYTALILKAGSTGHSVANENEVFENPEPGEYRHSEKDTISHVILCMEDEPPPVFECPEGMEGADGNGNGVVDEGECATPPVFECPDGMEGADGNGNGVVDEGECATPGTEEPVNETVTICHAKPPHSAKNGWNVITIAKPAIFKRGHDGHDKDIIPAFEYNAGTKKNPQRAEYEGKNLGTVFGGSTGAEVLANGCQLPEQPGEEEQPSKGQLKGECVETDFVVSTRNLDNDFTWRVIATGAEQPRVVFEGAGSGVIGADEVAHLQYWDGDNWIGFGQQVDGQECPPPPGEEPAKEKVTICHARPADSAKNGWIEITIAKRAALRHADQHDADIIPEFTYTVRGEEMTFEGKNLDTEYGDSTGAGLLEDGCQLPEEPGEEVPSKGKLKGECVETDFVVSTRNLDGDFEWRVVAREGQDAARVVFTGAGSGVIGADETAHLQYRDGEIWKDFGNSVEGQVCEQPGDEDATPVEPSVTNACAPNGVEITVPTTTGVEYFQGDTKVSGAVVLPVAEDAAWTYTVTPRATPGHELTNPADLTISGTRNCEQPGETPAVPTRPTVSCADGGITVVYPTSPGVVYDVVGVDGTFVPVAEGAAYSVVVTAAPADGYTLNGPSSFTLEGVRDCEQTPPTNPPGTNPPGGQTSSQETQVLGSRFAAGPATSGTMGILARTGDEIALFGGLGLILLLAGGAVLVATRRREVEGTD